MATAWSQLNSANILVQLDSCAPTDIANLLDLTQTPAAEVASRTSVGIKVKSRLISALVAGLIRDANPPKDPIAAAITPAVRDLHLAQHFVLDECQTRFGVLPRATDLHKLVIAQIDAGDYEGARFTLQASVNQGAKPWKRTFDVFMAAAGAQWDWNGVRWALPILKEKHASHLQSESEDDPMSLIARINGHIQLSDSPALDKLLEQHKCGDAQAVDLLFHQGRKRPVSRKRLLRDLLQIFCTARPSESKSVSRLASLKPAWDIYRLMRSLGCLDSADCVTYLASLPPETSAKRILQVANDITESGFNGKLDPTIADKIGKAKRYHEQFGGKRLYREVNALLDSDAPNHLDDAFRAFIKVRDWPEALPSDVTNRLVRGLLHGKYLGRAIQVFEAATAWSQLLPAGTLKWLVDAALERDAWSVVWKIIDGARSLLAPSSTLVRLWSPVITNLSVSVQADPASLPKLLYEFNRMVEQHGVNPNLEIVNSVALAYASVGDAASLTLLVEKWKGVMESPDALTLEAVCRAYGKTGSYGRALDELEGAVSRGIKPLQMTVNRLIATAPNADEGRLLIKKAESWGIVSDHSTTRSLAMIGQQHPGPLAKAQPFSRYEVIMSADPEVVESTKHLGALLSSGQIAAAERMFEDMRISSAPCPPNAVTYHLFVHHFARVDVVRAEYYLDAMVSTGIQPLKKSYSSLITGYARRGDFTAVEKVLDTMSTPPDVGIFNAIIAACSYNGHLQACIDWHKAMIKRFKLKPNHVTFVTLIAAFARSDPVTQSKLRTAVSLLRSMETHPDPNVRPIDHIPYTVLIAAFGRLADADGAEARWKEMIDFGIAPKVESYNALIGAYVTNGRLSNAMRTFERGFMTAQLKEGASAPLAPDATTFAVLAKGHADANDGAGLNMWLNVMGKMGVAPNAAVQGVVLGWLCRMDTQAAAVKWYSENVISSPTGATAVSILNGIAENPSLGSEAPSAGEEWLERLAQDGHLIDDVRVFTALAALYARNGDFDGTNHVLKKMRQRNISPNKVTYLILIDAAAKQQQVDLAWRLFEDAKVEAKSAGWSINQPLIVALMDASQRAGRMDLVRTCWDWIVNARWPRHPIWKPKDIPVITGSAASVYLDAIGNQGTLPALQDMWTTLNDRPGHRVDENQTCSYVEALIRLGAPPTAAIDVLKLRAARGQSIGDKIVKNLIGRVMQTAGKDQAHQVAATLREVVGSELVERAWGQLVNQDI
ncbi:hypothetical protein BDZ88DRAFT_418933 [Geranomyces variabilis]|nr:hypothetical protein BDZ88DRAFT_418933 [Geranomyces variabilis]